MPPQAPTWSSWITSRVNTQSIGPAAQYVIYVLAVVVVVLTVLLIFDNYYPFLPMNPFGGPSSVARGGAKFWTTSGANTENLLVPASESPTVRADTYTVSVQLVISDSRTPSPGKFRHILHRGTNPCGLTSTTSGSTGHAGIKASDLPGSIESTYKTLGLPAVMNPGLFLDKHKNDMHVYIHTRGTNNALLLESMTVEDLPLNAPITLGVVCNGQTLEVYVNCRLYSTLMLKGTPYLPAANNQWFGRYCAFPVFGVVKNLQLWDAALGSTDYMQMCRSLNFGKLELPTCSSAP